MKKIKETQLNGLDLKEIESYEYFVELGIRKSMARKMLNKFQNLKHSLK